MTIWINQYTLHSLKIVTFAQISQEILRERAQKSNLSLFHQT